MTRWVALLVRCGALWFGWQGYVAMMDLFSAMQVLHQPAGALPEWVSDAMARLAEKYSHTPHEISEQIYWQIGWRIFRDFIFAFVLWTGCTTFARILTEGLDNERASTKA